MCFDCCEKMKAKYKKSSNQLTKQAESRKRLYYRRKANGLCTKCGKESDTGGVLCSRCRAKHHRQQEQARRKNGTKSRKMALDSGFCWLCLKNPVMDDKKICLVCYNKVMPRLETARKNVDLKNHFFARDERVRRTKKR